MFVLLFASFETTSLALTLAMKFLLDNPMVLKRLTEEHEAIIRKREDADSALTWKEYKSMTFTFQVINETVRLANIVPGIFRKALRQIQFKGYTIPAGWAVMVCPPAVHLNPAKYEDPLTFNPWRWEVQMAVFLHCLVTRYRWQAIKGGNTVRTPDSNSTQAPYLDAYVHDGDDVHFVCGKDYACGVSPPSYGVSYGAYGYV
ncbi:hypothetical protein NL676_011305 [Syzygium grande]|nr:hypothetical protein NL676_011305 [Syzygium grande]